MGRQLRIMKTFTVAVKTWKTLPYFSDVDKLYSFVCYILGMNVLSLVMILLVQKLKSQVANHIHKVLLKVPFKAVFAKPKINYCDLTTDVNYTVNHSELVVHTRQALENTCKQVTVGFRKSGFRE